MLGIMRYSTAIYYTVQPLGNIKKERKKKETEPRERTKEVVYTAFHGRTDLSEGRGHKSLVIKYK